MRKVYYTTTEYLKILEHKGFKESNWAMFISRKEAQSDVDWLKKNFPVAAKAYGGPKVVSIMFKVLK